MKKVLPVLIAILIFSGCNKNQSTYTFVITLPAGENFEYLTIKKDGTVKIHTSFDSNKTFEGNRPAKVTVEQRIGDTPNLKIE